MEPEGNQDTNMADIETEQVKVDINSDESGNLSTVGSGSDESNQQWQEMMDRATKLLSDLPEQLSNVFADYRKPIVTVGLVVAAIIAVKLTLAVLDSVNDIPLLAPVFELIGLGYSAWFIYRYLLKASNRQELVNDFNSLKEQILGKNGVKS
jgi:hypothetical protein